MAKKKDKKPIKKDEVKKLVEKKKTPEKKPILVKKLVSEKKSTAQKKPAPEKKSTAQKKPVPEKKLVPKKKVEEELEEVISDEEIENFKIEGLDMEKLTNRVCNIVAERGGEGMLQSELWKKLKLTSRDGSRFALKLEKRNIIKREKVLDNGRWTYKLKISRLPVGTATIEAAPCLICPVESKCSLEGEVSPRTCPLIEQWVITEFANKKTKK
ncbi:MAG TPA: transcriptional regulator [Nitrosopumilaceae archaeon]|nr:transcriptional regulator [Nitrosopumilaceae archaeon]